MAAQRSLSNAHLALANTFSANPSNADRASDSGTTDRSASCAFLTCSSASSNVLALPEDFATRSRA